jgi:hypothetical protein
MLELVGLLLLIAVAFTWVFMAGVTERKTGHKNLWGWPFILVYWYGLGRPKPVTETKTIDPHAQPEPETLTKNIENLNNSILLLIQKLEKQKSATKKTIVKEPEKTNQGE